MRRLSILALLLFWLPAHAVTLVSGQTSVVVDDHWASSTASGAQTLPVAATAGNLIAVLATIGDGSGAASFSGIDDAGTTVYACERLQQDATLGVSIAICWGIAAGANAGTGVVVTASTTSSSTDDLIAIMEFTAVDGTQASLSDNGANLGSAGSHDSGSVTPGTTTNVIVALSRGGGAEWTVDADFTTLLDNNRTTAAYKLQASDTAQSYTITNDSNRACSLAIVAFKGSGGGGASVVPIIMQQH